jgi:hypothetical protein
MRKNRWLDRKEVKIVAFLQVVLLAPLLGISSVCAAQPSGREVTIFQDNFESYSVDSFPYSGSWEIVWNGMGDQYQIICWHSGNKAFQLWGMPGWSSIIQRKFSSDAPIIGYEFYIWIESRSIGGPCTSDHPGFFNEEADVWGAYWATVSFDHSDGKIKAGGIILGDWIPKTWYKVKVILDRERNLYDVWINDKLVGQNLETGENSYKINAIILDADHPGSKVYYDNVRVFSQQSSETTTAQTNDIVKAALIIGISIVIGCAIIGAAIVYSQPKMRSKKK